MKHTYLLLLLSVCTALSLRAQDYNQPAKSASAGGYYNLTQLTFLMGEVTDGSPVKSELIPSIVNITGCRVNDYFSIGAGVGMTYLPYTLIPVFADFRVTFLKGDLSPVLAFKGGYAFAKNNKDIWGYGNDNTKNTGGAMINPEIGFKVPMTEHADFVLTLGYWYQHLESEFEGYNYYQTHNRKIDLNRLSFTIGFLFK